MEALKTIVQFCIETPFFVPYLICFIGMVIFAHLYQKNSFKLKQTRIDANIIGIQKNIWKESCEKRDKDIEKLKKELEEKNNNLQELRTLRDKTYRRHHKNLNYYKKRFFALDFAIESSLHDVGHWSKFIKDIFLGLKKMSFEELRIEKENFDNRKKYI